MDGQDLGDVPVNWEEVHLLVIVHPFAIFKVDLRKFRTRQPLALPDPLREKSA